MNLTIDIGNSFVKLALFSGDELIKVESTKDLTIDAIKQFCGNTTLSNSIISSVAGYDNYVEQYLRNVSNLIILTETTPLPIKNCYKSSETLGRDRLAAVVGADSLYPGQNNLVIDIGTCITYDFINDKGEFIGGGISPGLDIRFRALNQFTRNLPLLEKEPVDYFIGTNTKDSMLSGVINGIINELNGTIAMYEASFSKLNVLLSGGDFRFFETNIKSNIFAVPNLVLYGLNKILQHNAS